MKDEFINKRVKLRRVLLRNCDLLNQLKASNKAMFDTFLASCKANKEFNRYVIFKDDKYYLDDNFTDMFYQRYYKR